MKQSHLDLHGQFVLRWGDQPRVAGWVRREHEAWVLDGHPGLPITEVRGSKGGLSGWLLGWAVDRAGKIPQPAVTLSTTLEDWVEELGGRFVVIGLCGERPQLHLDALGSLAVVYRQDARVAGSTTALVRDVAPKTRPFRRSERLAPNQFHPAGLTSDVGIQRLLPNHTLDLNRWCARRSWPVEPQERVASKKARDKTREIGARIRQLLKCATGLYPLQLGLTAGRDSRMLLACGRSLLRRLSFFTFSGDAAGERRDALVAEQLATRFGLDHKRIPCRAPTGTDRHTYLERIGFDGHWGKARDFFAAGREHLDVTQACVVGFGGEVGRGFYWHRVALERSQAAFFDPGGLLRTMNLSPHADNRVAIEEWLRSVAVQDVYELLDLAYLEHRVGAWAAPHLYGVAPCRQVFTPFADRMVIQAMLSLPVDDRLADRMPSDVIEREWPELLDVPFDRPPLVVKWARTATRLRRRQWEASS